MVLYCFLTDVLAQKFIQLWKKNHRLFSDGERYMHSSLYFYKL